MKSSAKTLSLFVRLAAVALLANIAMVACMPSSDGEMSDEEKLKAMSKGRESYSQGQKPPAGTTTGQATGN